MGDEKLNVVDAQAFATGHMMGRIPQFKTYEVMDHELDTLSDTTDDEMLNLGFFTGAIGILVSCVIAWITTEFSSEIGQAMLLAVTLVSAFIASFCGIKWSLVRRKRRNAISSIRERSVFIKQNLDGTYRRILPTEHS